MTACLSDLCLDELFAGELAGAAATTAMEHIAGCQRCRVREQALAADRERFRAAPPSMARRRPRWRAALIAVSAAAAAAVVVATLPRDPAGTRTKGGAHLSLVVQHAGAARVGATGERVHPGDTLTYLVTTAEPVYVTVLGRDAAGRVTAYVPTDRVAGGRDVQLPVATLLDDTLGREDIIAVFCARPMEIVSLNEPPAGCALDRLVIEKQP